MAAVVREGLRAGALGFSTSRTVVHRTKEKGYVPGTFAAVAEIDRLRRAPWATLATAYSEIITDLTGDDADLGWVVKMSKDTGRPVSLAALIGGRSGMRNRQLWRFSARAQCRGRAYPDPGSGPSHGNPNESGKLAASVFPPSQLPAAGQAESEGTGGADARPPSPRRNPGRQPRRPGTRHAADGHQFRQLLPDGRSARLRAARRDQHRGDCGA